MIFRFLPILFLFYSIPTVLFLCFTVPPMQAPDEYAHLFRAEQLSVGKIIGIKKQAQDGAMISGGYIDRNLFSATGRFMYLVSKPSAKMYYKASQEAGSVYWGGDRVFLFFSNTVVYPPFCYATQIVGIWIGKALDLSILDTYYLCRLLTALVSVLISFLALCWCLRGRVIMFTVLLFPMTQLLFASCSQDALLISGCMLLIAALSRLSNSDRQTRTAEYLLIVIITAAVITTRPPYIGLILLLLWSGLKYQLQGCESYISQKGWRIVAFLLVLSVTIAWSTAVSHLEVAPAYLASIQGQLDYLLNNPFSIFGIAVETLLEYSTTYTMGVIGFLGWLDTPFSKYYYVAATGTLIFAVIADSITALSLRFRDKIIVIFTLLICFFGIFGALYLRWSPVGSSTVVGVQGRYFIPLLPLLGFLVPSATEKSKAKVKVLLIIIALFPMLSSVLMNRLIIDRYYLTFYLSEDQPITGDWNNDGFIEIGIKNGRRWMLDNGNGVWDGCGDFPTHDVCIDNFGSPIDQPVTGDWDNDGFTEIGIVRGTLWFLDNGNGIWDGCGAFPKQDVCTNRGRPQIP